MTVRRLLATVDAHELAEWQAYYKICYEDEKEAHLRAELEAKARAGIKKHGNNRKSVS